MLEDIIKERLKKLEKYAGEAEPYPARVKRDLGIKDLLDSFSSLEKKGKSLCIVGRIRGWRDQGGIIFADLEDGGGKIQAVLNEKVTDNFELLRETSDLGDFLEVCGVPGKTKKGEMSVMAESAKVIVKSIRPWPSSWFGIEDAEEKNRKRYLDFIYNEESKDKIVLRSKITSELRNILDTDGFMEVETPIIQPIPGGALAAPFKTHFNALGIDVYLRIAPELYLKRLLVGGFEKIYEMGRDFRNEGIDRDHYPEFTMLELYWAYENYESLMDALENWLKALVKNLGLKKVSFNGDDLDWFGKWPRTKYADLIEKYSPGDMDKLNTPEIDEVFKKKVRPEIKSPVFVIDHPKAVSPLSKSRSDDPEFTERFQLVVAGTELVNGFSELNDPQDQRERMEEQEKRFRKGDKEASRMDEDFLEALEYGMPPAAGLGMGIDRLAILLSDAKNIKEVMTFTTLRPKGDKK